MNRILIAGAIAAGLLGLAAPPASAGGDGIPDGLIKVAGGVFKGNDVYDDGTSTAQTACRIGTPSKFVVKFQNDGPRPDKYTPFVFYDNESGIDVVLEYKGEDVTDQIEAQTLKLNKVKPGEKTKPIKVKVTIDGPGGTNGTTRIGGRSKHDLSADLVRASYLNSGGLCTA